MPENDPSSEVRGIGEEDDTLAEIVAIIKSLAKLHPDVTSISVTSGRRSISIARPEHTAPVAGQRPMQRKTSTHAELADTTAHSDNEDQPTPRHRSSP